jgi:hypothetical protein
MDCVSALCLQVLIMALERQLLRVRPRAKDGFPGRFEVPVKCERLSGYMSTESIVWVDHLPENR